MGLGNCILKTLEEPPEYVVIILITSNENAILSTIKSRCMKISFYENKSLELDNKEEIEKIFLNLENMDEIGLLEDSTYIYKDKENIFNILEYINLILFEKAKIDYRYIYCIEHVENAKNRLKQNANFDMVLDDMLFTILEEFKK